MHYVIIGSSAAGTAAARTIRGLDDTGKITIITQDNTFFSRCQLHLLATGNRSPRQSDFLPENWARNESIDILWGTSATSLRPQENVICTSKGEEIVYDRLLIATGSRSWTPPISGIEGELSFNLRNLEDAGKIIRVLPFVKTVSIIGAGLVGVELAVELAKAGKKVNIIELAPFPLPLQLETITGKCCGELLQKAGINLFCGKKVIAVNRENHGAPESLLLDDGQCIASEMIVSAAGVRPNITWLNNSGIQTEPRGILINEFAMTNINNVFAAGDVTVMKDILLKTIMPSPIWPTAVHQGRIAGINMTGGNDSLTRNTGLRCSVNLSGTSIVSLGPVSNPDPSWEKQKISYTDSRGKECLKILFRENAYLRAAVLWGDITDAGVYADAIINNRVLPENEFAGILDGAKFGQEERSIL